MMDQPPMSCELVDERELDRRYTAGTLSETEATAFEEHFFGCDRCWALVKGGAGVTAALRSGGVDPAVRGSRAVIPPVRKATWWKPMALVAGLAIVVLGTWRAVQLSPPANPQAIRGGRDSIAVHSELAAGRWRAAWIPVREATSYRVRVFTGDGRLLLTRESTDTSVILPADSLATLGSGGAIYLEVQGFDQLRRPLARSPLTPLSGAVR